MVNSLSSLNKLFGLVFCNLSLNKMDGVASCYKNLCVINVALVMHSNVIKIEFS